MTDSEETQAPVIREDVRFVGSDVQVGQLFAALAEAQGEFLPLGKDSEAEVKNKEGKYLYTFTYCPLDGVIAATRPALVKHKLALVQLPNGNELLTVLAHGPARIESRCYLSEWSTPQQFGGVLTYFKRYAMLSILAVFPAGEDDDANQAQGNQAAVTHRQKPPQVASKPPTNGGITPGTKEEVWRLAKQAGLNAKELQELSTKSHTGPLGELTETAGLILIAALKALQVRP